jgi:hypothetical protein
VWIETPVSDNFDLLTGNGLFPSDCIVTIIDNYIKFSKYCFQFRRVG